MAPGLHRVAVHGLGPLPPPSVTRGESIDHIKGAHEGKVKVDWLNCTFPKPGLSPPGFVAFLGRLMGRPVSFSVDKGMLGFENSLKLFAHHGSATTPIGCLAYGGESQNGRWLFQLTGTGCAFVKDWEELADFLESLGARLTRVDLALDFLNGEHSVEEALTLYQVGGFDSGGRSPSSRLAGDWLGVSLGRTLYVGKSQNGKMLRVYEKGRQLGDVDSEWVRFEVQLGNRDRVLPFDVLTRCDAYFAGCYPALASMILEAAEKISTTFVKGDITLAHLLFHFRRCYGKLINVMCEFVSVSSSEFLEEVRIVGCPKRLDLSSVAAGLSWVQVLTRLKAKNET